MQHRTHVLRSWVVVLNRVVLAVGLVVAAPACQDKKPDAAWQPGGEPVTERPTEPLVQAASPPQFLSEAPDWIDEKGGKQEELYFGVGKAQGIRNPALARLTAEKRAMAEIARLINETVRDEKVEGGEIRTVQSAALLRGARPVAFYIDPGGTVYARAEMPIPPEAATDAAARSPGAPSGAGGEEP